MEDIGVIAFVSLAHVAKYLAYQVQPCQGVKTADDMKLLEPYLVGILIGLAQARRVTMAAGYSVDTSVLAVHLLAVRRIRSQEVYLYRAEIPAVLLQCLESPSKTLEYSGIVVRRHCISLAKPLEAACLLWQVFHNTSCARHKP